jgi:hypothetical protein
MEIWVDSRQPYKQEAILDVRRGQSLVKGVAF